jgi:putative tributyrin esterase
VPDVVIYEQGRDMGVATVQFFSDALGRRTTFDAILPDTGTGPFPVLLQLHGLFDDHNSWIHKSKLVHYVSDMQAVVVLPDGGTSAYLDWHQHSERLNKQNFETMIVEDLWEEVHRNFNVDDQKWAIGGLSMGGYGAMRLGLRHPDKFSSIWAHSSAFVIGDVIPTVGLGDIEDASLHDLAPKLKGQTDLPLISFDCGTEDELIESNRDFDALLTDLGIAHHYAEHPGGHTWEYWDAYVVDGLKQHESVLGIKREPLKLW